MPRQSLINDTQLVNRLLDAVRAGNYYEAACGYAGIDYSTFRKWVVRGEEADELDQEGAEIPEAEQVYLSFFESLKRAENEAEARVVALWQRQIPNDWKAAATFLERRYASRWGRVDRLNAQIQHAGDVGLNVVIDTGSGTLTGDYADILGGDDDGEG